MTSTDKQPKPRAYSRQDLNPTKWDPQCKVPSPFPLGSFWPVYVGNFWCDNYSELATRVQEYFGAHGLLARMVFCRISKDDDPHILYAKEANLYDFLVYFVRQQDADDAISYCHREMYYGHRLNVFPGRKPVYFDQSKSVHHTLVQVNKSHITGQAFERHAHGVASARVDCVVMYTFKEIHVQYASVEDRNNFIRKSRVFTMEPLPDGQPKQRFLEQDVGRELLQRIRTEPSFLEQRPPDNILNPLLGGTLPVCPVAWKTTDMFKMPNFRVWYTRGGNNQLKMQRSAQRGRDLFGVEHDFYKAVPEEVKQARLERKQEKQRRSLEKQQAQQLLQGLTGQGKFKNHRTNNWY